MFHFRPDDSKDVTLKQKEFDNKYSFYNKYNFEQEATRAVVQLPRKLKEKYADLFIIESGQNNQLENNQLENLHQQLKHLFCSKIYDRILLKRGSFLVSDGKTNCLLIFGETDFIPTTMSFEIERVLNEANLNSTFTNFRNTAVFQNVIDELTLIKNKPFKPRRLQTLTGAIQNLSHFIKGIPPKVLQIEAPEYLFRQNYELTRINKKRGEIEPFYVDSPSAVDANDLHNLELEKTGIQEARRMKSTNNNLIAELVLDSPRELLTKLKPEILEDLLEVEKTQLDIIGVTLNESLELCGPAEQKKLEQKLTILSEKITEIDLVLEKIK